MEHKLHIKYRPTSFDDVVGQDVVIKNLRAAIKKKLSQVFLFHGPSGCGKTTLARISAAEFGCSESDLIEVDAATHTGIEHVRLLQEKLSYAPMLGGNSRAVILDEAHMLSKSAWNSLLKMLEDTPKHVVWFLCTTEPARVPKTITTRNFVYQLRSVQSSKLKKLVTTIARKEKIKLKSNIIDMIVEEAQGSPRQALVNLGKCSTAENEDDAAILLSSAIGSPQVIELCRLLVGKSCSWQKAVKIVNQLDDNPESVRIVVCNYVAAVALKSNSRSEVGRLLAILDAFRNPYNQSEKKAPLLLSLGELLLN